MMPKKAPENKRSIVIGVKVTQDIKKKIDYLAGMKAEKTSTYIYNLLQCHINDKEPWITKEIEENAGGIQDEHLRTKRSNRKGKRKSD